MQSFCLARGRLEPLSFPHWNGEYHARDSREVEKSRGNKEPYSVKPQNEGQKHAGEKR